MATNRKGLGDRLRMAFDSIFIKNANDPNQVARYDQKHPDLANRNGGGLMGRLKAGFGSFLSNNKR
jgi:hypothetical protein